MKNKYYISTAIAYTSGIPHVGNTYETVLADAIARYKRESGFDVYFQTGTDEHGEKIQIKAKENNLPEKDFVDSIVNEIKDICDLMNVSYDKFIRTTDSVHIKKVQEIFKKLYDKGDIYKSKYEGLYCTPCESFFTENQLVDGKCPDCGRKVEIKSEEAYFLKLSNYSEKLEKFLNSNPDFLVPLSRKNEMINNFIKPGLQDLCVSRTSFSWGIPVDFDSKHVVYVWMDALSNYITFLGYDIDKNHSKEYKKYWPCDLHVIGKDIVRFHTIYWLVLLMALEEELPKKIFGHPWILVGSEKMSKSRGNVIYAKDLVKYFGVDAVRYYMLHEIPFANDGGLTYELLIERINSDLANTLGNLVNRTMGMINKYFDGIVLEDFKEELIDIEFKKFALKTFENLNSNMDNLHVADAFENIFELLRKSNKYIDETMPWVLAKENENRERLATVLYNLIEAIRISAVLLKPFLPETSENIFNQINTKHRTFSTLNKFGYYEKNNKINESKILFARIDLNDKINEINNK